MLDSKYFKKANEKSCEQSSLIWILLLVHAFFLSQLFSSDTQIIIPYSAGMQVFSTSERFVFQVNRRCGEWCW